MKTTGWVWDRKGTFFVWSCELKTRRLPEMGRIISISRCCLSFPLSLWLRLSCRRESLRRWFPFIRSCWVLFFFALVTIWRKIVSARLNCLIMSLYLWRNLEIHYFLVQTDKSKISKPHSVHVSSFYKTRCHHPAQQITKRLRSPFYHVSPRAYATLFCSPRSAQRLHAMGAKVAAYQRNPLISILHTWPRASTKPPATGCQLRSCGDHQPIKCIISLRQPVKFLRFVAGHNLRWLEVKNFRFVLAESLSFEKAYNRVQVVISFFFY